ncbi:hypothetical protein D3C79_909600 [compost metagenome]
MCQVLSDVVPILILGYDVNTIFAPINYTSVYLYNRTWAIAAIAGYLGGQVVSSLKAIVTTTLYKPDAIGSDYYQCVINCNHPSDAIGAFNSNEAPICV